MGIDEEGVNGVLQVGNEGPTSFGCCSRFPSTSIDEEAAGVIGVIAPYARREDKPSVVLLSVVLMLPTSCAVSISKDDEYSPRDWELVVP